MLVFVILLVVDFILGLIFAALPLTWRSGLGTVISGTLAAPFLALVVTHLLPAVRHGRPRAAGQ